MINKVEINTPIFETIQIGEEIEERWETSDGQQFHDERSAEAHEFYECKVNQRGHNLPVSRVEIFDFTCSEDVSRYEADYMYNEHIKMYDKEKMVFPNTYVMYETYEIDEDDYNEEWDHYGSKTLVHFATLEEYKTILIDAVNNLR